MNLNKVFLLGNLASDPETRTTPSGQQVCNFRMATNRVWSDRQTGEKKQQAEFHRIVVWGKLATIASQYLAKGRLVFIEGRLMTRSWEDKSGNKRFTTEIVADSLQLGPRPIRQDGAVAQNNTPKQKDNGAEDEIPIIEENENIDVEDIPF